MVPSPLGASRNGETGQSLVSTYAEGLCNAGEKVGVETYFAFARAKLGILQETISEWKNKF